MADVTVTLGGIVKHFESLSDPRHARNRRHLLIDVIVICGVIVGCKGPTSIERWAKAKQEWLGEFLELPNGIPSRDCLRRILSALKPEAFQKCFQEWIASCLLGDVNGSHRTIAIDGKTMRRSHDRACGLGPLHYRQCLGERTRHRAGAACYRREVERNHGHSRAYRSDRPKRRGRDDRRDGSPESDRQEDHRRRRRLCPGGQRESAEALSSDSVVLSRTDER